MKNFRAIQGGRQAKKIGDDFEKYIQYHATRIKAAYEKIPSGCRWVSGKRAISVKTPFDYILSKNKITVFFDAKTIKDGAFSHSKIEPHQLRSLYSFFQQGVTAGYIVWFRDVNAIRFFSALDLKNLKAGQSLKNTDGLDLGSITKLNLEVFFQCEEPQP